MVLWEHSTDPSYAGSRILPKNPYTFSNLFWRMLSGIYSADPEYMYIHQFDS